jgi:hypothetical protein
MDGRRDDVPAYRTVRVTAPDAPAAALADTEAWQARGTYPDLRFGGPVFGVAREREQGGWELHPFFSALAPQDARDSMGSHFRKLAQAAERSGDGSGGRECMRAAERMDREAVDEMTVLGTRYRVVRADRFIRSGAAGPEPPRPSDGDPGEPGRAHEVADPAVGFVIDPVIATGMSEGILKMELLEAIPKEGTVPPEVREDAVRAARTHPGGVLLPPVFTTAELVNGQWGPAEAGTSPTPQGARDGLAACLRVTIPWQLDLGPQQRAVYAAAAGQLDAERAGELAVAGRRFRVVRVERLVRVGPDGPEGSRPSDPDPQPPVLMQAEQLREQGVLTDDDEDAPVELDEDAKRFLRLFHEEEERRRRTVGNT